MSGAVHSDPVQLIQGYRSLPILGGYLILAGALAVNACRIIYVRYCARLKQNDWDRSHGHTQFLLFASLAGLSLGATWYYMFAFFAHSYHNWAASQPTVDLVDPQKGTLFKLELWLQNAKLFREAWETVIETRARFWWSGQIFLWTTGWSVFLGVMGDSDIQDSPRMGLHAFGPDRCHLLCAESVLRNNSCLSKATTCEGGSRMAKNVVRDPVVAWSPPVYLEAIPVAISLISTVLVPSVAHTKYFMLLLLIPHLLLFVPAILRPSRSWSRESQAQAGTEEGVLRRYVTGFKWYTAACVAIQAHSTFLVLQDNGLTMGAASLASLARHLPSVIYEHPAVSSVSWDVIMCTATAIAWIVVNGGEPRKMLGQ
ncbi:hypothetical protein N7539_000944 [Penicillium diatomitis]|uniref:Uncharacterized protein n=1 Tax=Penicillium diatomitis TaxID=2819901 RepID=A0A9W9XMP1_9EURO|nr:uncharacterized protein N7539_000944 [Penicillium diatomitis]KAJ5495828.1 hypothetical protein N7539_000944 [Penicillium diatomitis]